jgi:hypothetical protein
MSPRPAPKPSPPDGAAVLEVFDRRLRELAARDALLTLEIVSLENSGGTAHGNDAVVTAEQAEALLDGAAFITREKPISKLARLHAERGVIRAALAIGSSRKERLALERAGDVFAQHFTEIAELETSRVMCALALQRIDRARETLRERLRKAGAGGLPLPTDGVELLGLGDREDDVRWAVQRVIADGIATPREIAEAQNGRVDS